MLGNEQAFLASRRSFLGGLGLLAVSSAAKAETSLANTASTTIDLRLPYQARLSSRLDDAGGGSFDLDFARTLLEQTNGFRKSCGLDAFVWDEGLAATAQAHAADMVHRGFFDHISPEGFSHLDRVSLITRTLCGRTAENLIWRGNDPPRQTPAGFEALWEQSEGHRHNLMRPTFTSAGYGVVRINSRYYAAGVYSDAAIRLTQSLPLQVFDRKALTDYLGHCHPSVRSFAVTQPFKDATSIFSLSDEKSRLPPGAWQIRPLVEAGDRLDVLPGPTFFILA